MCDILDDIKGWRCSFCLIIVFTKQKRARNRANFHCCRLEQRGVIEVWLHIVSAEKFGTVMLAHGLEMFLLKRQLMFPAYTKWWMSMPLLSDWSY